MELFENFGDVCKWGLTDLYPEAEVMLRSALEKREPFDTGWGSCKKEIRSFRVYSDGSTLHVQTYEEIDEPCDLIYDAMDIEVELTEEQEDEILDLWYEVGGMTEFELSSEIPLTTYEDLMKEISRQENENSIMSEEMFNIMKETVRDYTDRKENH